MSLAPRRAAWALFASLLAACGPGACTAPPHIEICTFAMPMTTCERPQGGLAAGVRYVAMVEGPSLPEGEVVLEIFGIREDGTERSLATIEAHRAENAPRVTQPILLQELGRYRLEVRTSDGHLLGQKTFEVTIPTVHR